MADAKVTLDIKGLEQLIKNEPAKVENWMDSFGFDLLSRIVLSFGTSPSAVGDPPGVDTGALRASMKIEKTGPMERTISDGVEYGLFLEYGTESIGPRPFMVPAFTDAQKRVGDDARKNLGLENL